MRKFKFLSLILSVGLLVSISSNAQAFWPTIDFKAIIESVKAKIELVKQSKIVADGTATMGRISATVGNAKSSFSKYITDNTQRLKKLDDKRKKITSDLKEAKAYYKDQYGSVMAEYNSVRRDINKTKAKVENTVNNVNNTIDRAKNIESEISTAKQKIEQNIENKIDKTKDTAIGSITSGDKNYEETGEGEGNAVSNAIKGFREKTTKPVIDAIDSQVGGQTTYNDIYSTITVAYSEPLIYAAQAEEESDEEKDDEFFAYDMLNDVFVLPLTLSDFCQMQPQEAGDVTRVKSCLLELESCMNSTDMNVAADCKGVYRKIMQEMNTGITSTNMAFKVDAITYEEKVANPTFETMGNNSTTRDDSTSIATGLLQMGLLINKQNIVMYNTNLSAGLARMEGHKVDPSKSGI